MKDIVTISQEEFQRCLPGISTGSLKNLLEGLVALIKQQAKRGFPIEHILELERKQTKIWKELQRRKVLSNKTNEDFHNWLFPDIKRPKR